MKKEIIKHAAAWILVYLTVTFIMWNPNPAQWSEPLRFLVATAALSLNAWILGYYLANKE